MDLVSVDKRTLHFQLSQASRDGLISDTLSVRNLSSERLAFKVKTTNQARYIVRPNVGVIPPDSHVHIFIGVQPSSDLPPPGPSRDKFLLRVAPSAGVAPLSDDFWVVREDDRSIVGLKFRVSFDPPSSELPSTPIAAKSPALLQTPPQTPSPPSQPDTPHQAEPEPEPEPEPEAIADVDVDTPTPTPARASAPPDDILVTPPRPSPQSPLSNTRPEILSVSPAAMPHTDDPVPAGVPETRAAPDPLLDAQASEFLSPHKYAQAMQKVRELQLTLDDKNLELSRLKTELAETRAETQRVLNDAPAVPLQSHKLLADPFGGVSVTTFALMLLLFLLLANLVLYFV